MSRLMTAIACVGLSCALAAPAAVAGPGPGGGGYAFPIIFDLASFGSVPTVGGRLGDVTSGVDMASGVFELGAPGPGPIEPVDTTAAVLLEAYAGAAPEGLVVFQSGVVFGFPEPAQINQVSFYAAGAAGCPTLVACVPAGIDPGDAILTGGLQDISKSFAPTFHFFDNDGLDVEIKVDLPTPIPEPATLLLFAAGMGGLLLLRRCGRSASATAAAGRGAS